MAAKQLHSVLVSPGFPKHADDTTCLPFLQDLVKGLRTMVQITIVAEDHPVQADYEWHGLPVHTLRKSASTFGKITARFKLAATLDEIHRQKKIDVVHVFWLNWAAVQANQWCLKNEVKMVLTFAGREPQLPDAWVKRFHAFRATTIAVSDFHKEHLQQRGFCIDEVIEWSVPSFAVKGERDVDFVWCGSMIAVKQPEWFIQCVAELLKKGWQGRAVMIGDDPTGKYKQEISARGWQKRVVFAGLIPPNEVFAWMQRAHVFVHTAAYEAYGRVLAEALANGCKVVSTPVGLAHGHHAILTGDSVAQISQLCWELLQDTKEIIPQAAECFPEQQYAALYKRLL